MSNNIKDTSKEEMRSIIAELTNGFKYDLEAGSQVACAVQAMPIEQALPAVYENLLDMRSGCCFNIATACAYRLHSLGRAVCIIASAEENGIKISLMYRLNGDAYIADPVETIKEVHTDIDEVVAIPYDVFVTENGEVAIYDLDGEWDNTYCLTLFSGESNTTVEEFLQS